MRLRRGRRKVTKWTGTVGAPIAKPGRKRSRCRSRIASLSQVGHNIQHFTFHFFDLLDLMSISNSLTDFVFHVLRHEGQEKHVGAKALPRELQLETVVMPPDPEIIRIQVRPQSSYDIMILLHSSLYCVLKLDTAAVHHSAECSTSPWWRRLQVRGRRGDASYWKSWRSLWTRVSAQWCRGWSDDLWRCWWCRWNFNGNSAQVLTILYLINNTLGYVGVPNMSSFIVPLEVKGLPLWIPTLMKMTK